jgi:hypothetical protein
LVQSAKTRTAFSQLQVANALVASQITKSRYEFDQARLLALQMTH